MNKIEKLLAVAAAEVGYLEKSRAAYNADPNVIFEMVKGAGYDNYTKFAYYMDAIPGWYHGKKQGHAWCNVFTDYCFYRAFGVAMAAKITNHSQYGASVGWSADAYKDMGRLVWKNPRPGDQIYFGQNYDSLTHTGLVYRVDDNYVYTIEGNTSVGDNTIIPNGGGVCRKKYSRYYVGICCFGRPMYELIEKDVDDMTDQEIFEAVQRYANSRNVPAGMQDEYQEAIDLGITDGSRPMALCTRVESTLMTERAVEKMVEKAVKKALEK